ncbi:hypothetical protein EI555_008151, partial [Monodon monoceros]
PATWLPVLATDIWSSYSNTDINKKEQSELDQGLVDVEEVEEETGEESKIKAGQLTVQMLQNPQILAALQERFDGLVETPTGYIESLPRVVKRQVNAVKILQKPNSMRKFMILKENILFSISLYLISDLRSLMNLHKKNENEILEELKEKAKIEDEKKDKEKADSKGIPEFWLTIFKNVDLLSDMFQEHDKHILKHLKDMKVKSLDADWPMSFVLEFHFEPSEYFTSELLTKTHSISQNQMILFLFLLMDQKLRVVQVPESGDLVAAAEASLAADLGSHHFLHECIIPRSVYTLLEKLLKKMMMIMMKKVKKRMRKGKKKEMRKMIQTMTQRRIKTQQRESSREAG